jgi:REP element-mobilizing transposase RayT
MKKKFSNLPHIDTIGHYQFITFRTHDSIDDFLKKLSDENIKTELKQYKMDKYTDSSLSGCYLNGELLEYLKNFFLKQNSLLYELVAFCIMPNHVHMLLKQKIELAKMMKQIKGSSANSLNKLLHKKGKFWESGYYDKGIRDERHLMLTYEYIKNNPLKVGLEKERFFGIYE